MNRPARILILTNGPLARNPRVAKEAAALGGAGHAVTVLGIRSHRPSVTLDTELVARAAHFRHEQVELLDGPAAWLRRARSRLARELAKRGARPSVHTLGPAAALLRAARARPADLVIVHNEIAHWAGLRLLAAGRRVAADIEDWHSEDLLPEARSQRPLDLLARQERELLRRAAYCTTTSRALAEALHLRHGGRSPDVLTNSFPLGPARPPCADGAAPELIWFSQTIGPGRGLEAFIAAWSATRVDSRLHLVGEALPGYADTLCRNLPASHRQRIRVRPPVAPSELPALLATQDIGLALEPRVPANKDLTISNKILQYLNAGLAVVATPTAGQREVLARGPEAGLLLDFSEPNAAASALDSLLADGAALRRRQIAARSLAETCYCWENEAPRLIDLVARALAAPPGTVLPA